MKQERSVLHGPYLQEPTEEILKAAYWSSSNSFISSYYLRDIPAAEGSFSRAALAAAAESRPTS